MRIGIVDDAVEDRKLVRREMNRCLRESGMESAEYSEFDSGESLLAVYRAGMFDLLFLDICMGGITGTETGIAIRKLDRHVKIVFITSSNDYAAESYRAKASHYLLKPHNYAQFHEMFEELALTPDLETPGSFLSLPDGMRTRTATSSTPIITIIMYISTAPAPRKSAGPICLRTRSRTSSAAGPASPPAPEVSS